MRHEKWKCPKCDNDEFETDIFQAQVVRLPSCLMSKTGSLRLFHVCNANTPKSTKQKPHA